ncbi:Urease accessory protein UreD 2 [Bienertia sinuspersici]
MDGLEDKLQGLTMTEEEEAIIECEEDEEGEVVKEQLQLCLVGKILTHNPFSVDAMKNTLKLAWRLGKGMVVREIERNMFIFQFFSALDKLKVIDGGSWSSRRALDKRTSAMVKSMATSIGEIVEFDNSDPIGWSKYMRFRVDLNINKPLKRWTRIATPGGSKLASPTRPKNIDMRQEEEVRLYQEFKGNLRASKALHGCYKNPLAINNPAHDAEEGATVREDSTFLFSKRGRLEEIKDPPSYTSKPFRFEVRWLNDELFDNHLKNVWSEASMQSTSD